LQKKCFISIRFPIVKYIRAYQIQLSFNGYYVRRMRKGLGRPMGQNFLRRLPANRVASCPLRFAMSKRESKSFASPVLIVLLIIALNQAKSEESLKKDFPQAKFEWPSFGWMRNKTTKVKPSLDMKNDYSQMELGNFGDFDRHPCRRVCQQGQSQNCYYQLVVHNYQRLGPECQRCQFDERACAAEHCIFGDGVANPVMAVNRMVPGPPIELCENDTMVVDVLNYLGEPTTMHWHGIHMHRTPEMDGAPFVTQRKKYAHGTGNQASDTRDTRLPLASNLVIKCAGFISVYIATTPSHHN